MFQKKYFVISVSIVYFILIILFYKLQQNRKLYFNGSCYSEMPCVKFCCANRELCDESYVDKNFNASLLPDNEFTGWKASQGIQIFLELPSCAGSLELIDPNKSWKFELVSEKKIQFE